MRLPPVGGVTARLRRWLAYRSEMRRLWREAESTGHKVGPARYRQLREQAAQAARERMR